MIRESAGQDASLSVTEEEAFGLSQAAVMLDQGRANPGLLAQALNHNMELWVAIRVLVSDDRSPLPAETRRNLAQLSTFITETIVSQGVEMAPQTLDTLININLQISEGLLEGLDR
ncbi:MAG: hypothetical protein KDE22_07965 [Rhodobacterales bacterium]|nr:hypothetical protein [Rhodobacterales bacterium]